MNSKAKKISAAVASVATGGASGFFGGGGGMLAVPLLKATGMDEKKAHATAILVILPICIVCSVIYIRNGYFDARAMISACLGVVFGGAAGATLFDKLDKTVVGVVFSLLMITAGIKSVIP